jgi:hypothetical protein
MVGHFQEGIFKMQKKKMHFLGDSSFQFSKERWNKLFQFSTVFTPDDRTLRVMGQFTQSGIEELSNQAHTLEVYCQIPPLYGK